MLSQTTFAVLGLTLSSFVFAGTEDSTGKITCTPKKAIVPCEEKRWDMGVRAQYLKPIYNNGRAYLIVGNNNFEMKNKWGWGFEAQGSYHFNTGNDLALNWIRYDVQSNIGIFLGDIPNIGPAHFNMKHLNRFDQVNLVMGQRTDLGIMKNARFYAGLQYTNIRSTHLRTYQQTEAALAQNITRVTEHNRADFNGVGPIMGIDFAYDIFHGVSLTANGATSILYGTSRNGTGFVYAPTGQVPSDSYGSKKVITSSLATKLGLNYAHVFAQGMLNLSIGYQAVNYYKPLALISTNGGSSSHFALFGPYLGLHWLGLV